MKDYQALYGPWALVTGASSGIGAAYAHQLAAQGLHVVLVARRQAALETLAATLKREYAVQTRVIVADLSQPDCLSTLVSATEDLEIGLLINNAGASLPGAFLKQPLAGRTDFLHLNVMTPMQLTYHYAELMVARGRGGIVMLASVAGYSGAPYIASYAAAKSYQLKFGLALNVELKEHGVDVLVLAPGATLTGMVETEGLDMRQANIPWMTAENVAKTGMQALGRTPVVIAGRLNRITTFLITRFFPAPFAVKLLGKTMRPYLDDHLH